MAFSIAYGIYYLLRGYNLAHILNAYAEKYDNVDKNRARRCLLYHEDIDFTAKIQLLDTKLKWKNVVKSLIGAVQQYEKDKAHKLFVQQLKEAIKPNMVFLMKGRGLVSLKLTVKRKGLVGQKGEAKNPSTKWPDSCQHDSMHQGI